MTDLLVRNARHGNGLARVLGHNNVALMRGHGNVCVGADIMTAVYRAAYTEVNARLQAQAIALCAAAREQISRDSFLGALTRYIGDLPAHQEYGGRLSKIPALLSSRAKPQEVAGTLGNVSFIFSDRPR
jgi:ribulose-5-phosphate 4-epimerase/fuculose-1-phosphate aldolase